MWTFAARTLTGHALKGHGWKHQSSGELLVAPYCKAPTWLVLYHRQWGGGSLKSFGGYFTSWLMKSWVRRKLRAGGDSFPTAISFLELRMLRAREFRVFGSRKITPLCGCTPQVGPI